MDIEYTFPGSIEVTLSNEDRSQLAFRRYVTERNGFRGIESKTWVRLADEDDVATASIDGDGDLNITVSSNSVPPTVIEAKDVQPGPGADADIAAHFLGASGMITLDMQARKEIM
ncbi:MAG: hypothetical protein V4678_02220 [Patescibacteria group bacterium]